MQHRIFQMQILIILHNVLNNVLFDNLSFIPVVTRILVLNHLNWTFLFFADFASVSVARRSRPQKLLGGITSNYHIFLAHSSVRCLTILRQIRMFESSTQATLSRHTVVVLRCIGLDFEVLGCTAIEEFLLTKVHVIDVGVEASLRLPQIWMWSLSSWIVFPMVK